MCVWVWVWGCVCACIGEAAFKTLVLLHTHQVRELLPFASVLGFAVEEYAASKGKIPPRKRRKKKVVYIATIEKVQPLIWTETGK